MSDKKYMETEYLKKQVKYWAGKQNEAQEKRKAYQAEIDRREK